jgi:hypothetical protein
VTFEEPLRSSVDELVDGGLDETLQNSTRRISETNGTFFGIGSDEVA